MTLSAIAVDNISGIPAVVDVLASHSVQTFKDDHRFGLLLPPCTRITSQWMTWDDAPPAHGQKIAELGNP